MPDLSASHLRDVRELITEPLQATIAAQMESGHSKLAGAIDSLGEKFLASEERFRLLEHRVAGAEVRIGMLERFKARTLLIYSGLTLVLSLGFGFAREWVRGLAQGSASTKELHP